MLSMNIFIFHINIPAVTHTILYNLLTHLCQVLLRNMTHTILSYMLTQRCK